MVSTYFHWRREAANQWFPYPVPTSIQIIVRDSQKSACRTKISDNIDLLLRIRSFHNRGYEVSFWKLELKGLFDAFHLFFVLWIGANITETLISSWVSLTCCMTMSRFIMNSKHLLFWWNWFPTWCALMAGYQTSWMH